MPCVCFAIASSLSIGRCVKPHVIDCFFFFFSCIRLVDTNTFVERRVKRGDTTASRFADNGGFLDEKLHAQLHFLVGIQLFFNPLQLNLDLGLQQSVEIQCVIH